MNGWTPTHRVTLYFEDGTRFVEESNLKGLMRSDSPEERKNLIGTWELPFEEGTIPALVLTDFKLTWNIAHLVVMDKGQPDQMVVEAL